VTLLLTIRRLAGDAPKRRHGRWSLEMASSGCGAEAGGMRGGCRHGEAAEKPVLAGELWVVVVDVSPRQMRGE